MRKQIFYLHTVLAFILIGFVPDVNAQVSKKDKQTARVEAQQAKLEKMIAQEISNDSLLTVSEAKVDSASIRITELKQDIKEKNKGYKVESKQLKKELKTKDKVLLKKVKGDIKKLDKSHAVGLKKINTEIKNAERVITKSKANITKAKGKLKTLKGKIKAGEKKMNFEQEKLDKME